MNHIVISAPLIGHGNPFAALALEKLAQQQNVDTELVFQKLVPRLGNIAHQFRTSVPQLAERYTKDSSAREGLPARMFGRLSFIELCYLSDTLTKGSDLHLTQEHALLGISPHTLAANGVESVSLVVPDVFPKSSGKQAVSKHDIAKAVTWNQRCYDELLLAGTPVDIVKPFYLDAFRPDIDDFMQGGKQVVVKTSGSGMPSAWYRQLLNAVQELNHTEWVVHTPSSVQYAEQSINQTDIRELGYTFFNDLGGQTECIIGFPSELVNIAFDMQSRGVPVQLIAMPPRGEHEMRNLHMAYEHGLTIAELRFDDKAATLDGLRVVKPEGLEQWLHCDVAPRLQTENFLGEAPYWQTQQSITSTH